MNKAVIVLCRCPEAHRMIGIRTEQVGRRQWVMTWAFPIKEESANREGYGSTTISGSVGATDDFNGCPICGTKDFMLCLECGKVYCNNSRNGRTTCPWCGVQGRVDGGAGKVNFKAGGDR